MKALNGVALVGLAILAEGYNNNTKSVASPIKLAGASSYVNGLGKRFNKPNQFIRLCSK